MAGFAPDVMLNWLCRYLSLRDVLQGDALESLLEVGSGPKGLGCVVSNRFVGVDVAFAQEPSPPMLPIVYGGTRLPFKPGAFHTVVSMDAMEHVPPAARAGFLLEMTRVSASRVIIGCPVDLVGAAADRFFQDLYRAMNRPAPDWLYEHQELGLPASRDLERLYAALPGWRCTELSTPGALPALLLILADHLPGMAPWIQSALQDEPEKLEAWIRAGDFGPKIRRVYLLERLDQACPLVHMEKVDTLVSAFDCPDCEGDLENPASGLVCSRCGRQFSSDAQGVWSFRPTPATRVPAPPVVFDLAPQWLQDEAWVPLVHNYLQAFSVDDEVVLWIRVDTNVLSIQEALELLAPIIVPYGELPFATLELAEHASPLPPGRVIPLPAGGEEVLAWEPDKFRLVRLMSPASPVLAQ
ncbi:MAG TPA: class I SAM-dependent methyltransferase [Oscillatoriaceae cyanobacterium]